MFTLVVCRGNVTGKALKVVGKSAQASGDPGPRLPGQEFQARQQAEQVSVRK